jgi:hypothetical protein
LGAFVGLGRTPRVGATFGVHGILEPATDELDHIATFVDARDDGAKTYTIFTQGLTFRRYTQKPGLVDAITGGSEAFHDRIANHGAVVLWNFRVRLGDFGISHGCITLAHGAHGIDFSIHVARICCGRL